MPFQPQNTLQKTRPKRGQSLRELLRNHPLKDKRELVKKAYKFALDGDVRWAEWIAKVSGETAAMECVDGSDRITVSQSVSGSAADVAELARLINEGRDAKQRIVVESSVLVGRTEADDPPSD